MNKTERSLPFAFDDIPIIGSRFIKASKIWRLYFDEHYDVEKDIVVEGYCSLSIEKWDTILFKEHAESLIYQTIDDKVMLDFDQIAHMEYDEGKKQMKMVLFTKHSKFYDIVFTNASCNLKEGKLLSEIDYHNILVRETYFLRDINALVLCLNGFRNHETKVFNKQSCAIAFRYVKVYIKEIGNNQKNYSYMRSLNYDISQILDIKITERQILLTAVIKTGENVSIRFEDTYVTFYEGFDPRIIELQ